MERSGPALTVIVTNGERGDYEMELLHVDFTFALFCNEFPDDYSGNIISFILIS